MEQLIINSIKSLFAFFFMAEHLNDLLAIHHLFHKTFCPTNSFLLLDKEFCRASPYFLYNIQHEYNTCNYHQRHPDTVVKHDAEYCRYHNSRI